VNEGFTTTTPAEEATLRALAAVVAGAELTTPRLNELVEELGAIVATLAARPPSEADPAADRWLVMRADDRITVLGDAVSLHATLTDARPQTIRLSHKTGTCSVEPGPGPRRVKVSRDGVTIAERREVAGELVDDASPVGLPDPPPTVTLDHVGGATVLPPPPTPPREPPAPPPVEAESAPPAAATPPREPPTPPPAPWRATHLVGAQPLPVGGVPAGTFAPGTVLDPHLEVQLIETTAEGWALVECANSWRCYVAAWGLDPLTP
jgi:hypothetical protein